MSHEKSTPLLFSDSAFLLIIVYIDAIEWYKWNILLCGLTENAILLVSSWKIIFIWTFKA